jgi:hypothetical protein
VAAEGRMPRKYSLETAEERYERLKRQSLRAVDEATVADDAVDAMVKRSIELHGP